MCPLGTQHNVGAKVIPVIEMPIVKQHTIEELRAALEASYRSMTPREHFQRMIDNGLINSQGQLTKLFGGDAEIEPWARRPAPGAPRESNGKSGPG